ncbi:dTDP-4-dehydrorhamnose reductase [Chitinophagaceae bacterium LB-8]|jgi:dTDP-4-dehydrorhamnose reductase|uniref:dTDP-4-dehydrorhamnose reductase n=1 Tax=Paraflavisolibacter caeni TaxID=2982496 RepID=A0A9X2XSP8_9BACT|nr:dTDP-4-dehydrorhamnose reductase [Paraflavisolibacter caeni]MCU7548025.1 dTDP-4-dehydrorhamnose reductase [Paraflavisolibacter caeni]
MKKIIVIGSHGQLGSELKELASRFKGYQFFFYDKEHLDIVQKDEVDRTIEEIKPDYLVNCAAYTAVDKAETDATLAFAINSEAVRNLAEACTGHNVKLVHVSTDYVFDGKATQPYKESDPVNPANVYGQSKLKGEEEAVQANTDVIIIRTAWVYSTYGANFVKTMLRLMQSRPEIGVVADQYGTPTNAADLAEVIMQIIDGGKWVPGIYHFTNEGLISWFDFANEIKRLSNASCTVNPITTEQYPTPAQRPQYSVLDKTKIQQTFGIKLKNWRESLEKCIGKMKITS